MGLDSITDAFRAHPLGMLIYLLVAAYLGVRLVGMLRHVWRVSRSPQDRRAAVLLSVVLTAAFGGLCSFLFLSLFA